MKIISILIYSIISSLAMISIRFGGVKSNLTFECGNIFMNINVYLLLGFLLYFISFLLCLFILQKFNLAYFSAISYGINFIITSILSYFLLDEILSVIQYLGAVIIIIGIIIISFSKEGKVS